MNPQVRCIVRVLPEQMLNEAGYGSPGDGNVLDARAYHIPFSLTNSEQHQPAKGGFIDSHQPLEKTSIFSDHPIY